MTELLPPAPDDAGASAVPARRGPSRRLVAVVGGALALALVVGLALAVVYARRVHDHDNRVRSTATALTVAEQFALRVDTFDGAHLDTYVSRVSSMLTTKEKTDFNSQFTSFKKIYAEGNAKGTGKVLVAGVTTSDADSATVMVVHDASVTSNYGNQQQNLRWSVAMAKVNGHWLVDSFTPVN